MLYHPTRDEYVVVQNIPIKPKDIYVNSSDGVQLHAWQFRSPNKKTKAVILQFHGNGQNLTAHFASLYPVLSESYDLIVFDYRGYGQSTGEPTPSGLVADGKVMLRWVHENYPQTPLIVFAQSLGGAVAMRSLLELQNEIPIHLLILDSTFASYRKAARQVLARHWLTWLFQPFGWLFIDNSTAVSGQLSKLGPYKKLVVHGTHDNVVSYNLGREVFVELAQPKEFWSIEGGHHIDFIWRENGKYAERLFKEIFPQ